MCEDCCMKIYCGALNKFSTNIMFVEKLFPLIKLRCAKMQRKSAYCVYDYDSPQYFNHFGINEALDLWDRTDPAYKNDRDAIVFTPSSMAQRRFMLEFKYELHRKLKKFMIVKNGKFMFQSMNFPENPSYKSPWRPLGFKDYLVIALNDKKFRNAVEQFANSASFGNKLFFAHEAGNDNFFHYRHPQEIEEDPFFYDEKIYEMIGGNMVSSMIAFYLVELAQRETHRTQNWFKEKNFLGMVPEIFELATLEDLWFKRFVLKYAENFEIFWYVDGNSFMNVSGFPTDSQNLVLQKLADQKLESIDKDEQAKSIAKNFAKISLKSFDHPRDSMNAISRAGISVKNFEKMFGTPDGVPAANPQFASHTINPYNAKSEDEHVKDNFGWFEKMKFKDYRKIDEINFKRDEHINWRETESVHRHVINTTERVVRNMQNGIENPKELKNGLVLTAPTFRLLENEEINHNRIDAEEMILERFVKKYLMKHRPEINANNDFIVQLYADDWKAAIKTVFHNVFYDLNRKYNYKKVDNKYFGFVSQEDSIKELLKDFEEIEVKYTTEQTHQKNLHNYRNHETQDFFEDLLGYLLKISGAERWITNTYGEMIIYLDLVMDRITDSEVFNIEKIVYKHQKYMEILELANNIPTTIGKRNP